ncbi:hypothetical protein J6590_011420 [Homalodisca vitripennis]|nr:hypothetical protein J6590_011420 [Homalodisca vitripennis]
MVACPLTGLQTSTLVTRDPYKDSQRHWTRFNDGCEFKHACCCVLVVLDLKVAPNIVRIYLVKGADEAYDEPSQLIRLYATGGGCVSVNRSADLYTSDRWHKMTQVLDPFKMVTSKHKHTQPTKNTTHPNTNPTSDRWSIQMTRSVTGLHLTMRVTSVTLAAV